MFASLCIGRFNVIGSLYGEIPQVEKTPGRFMKALIRSFRSTPIKGLSVILVTQVVDLYSYLPGQF
jgi:hypothetical protein